jgi:hypothetical protein
MIKLRSVMCALVLVASGRTMQASLIGATVDVSGNSPTATTVVNDGGNKVVSGAIEYPIGSFPTFEPGIAVDINATQMLFSINQVGGVAFGSSGSFKGFVLSVISGTTILSAVADASSNFNPISISIVGGNVLQLDYQGVVAPNSAVSVIDITTSASAPEPGTWLLVLTSCVGALLLKRRPRSRI